jgi:hypothetical protein
MDAMTKRSGLSSRVSDVEYMQAVLLIDLTFMALQKSLIWFSDQRSAQSFRDFRFIYDAKLPTKLGTGEKCCATRCSTSAAGFARSRTSCSHA